MTEAVAVVMMTAEEARQITDAIKQGETEKENISGRQRQMLLAIYEQEGWKALGYAGITEYAEAEFDYGRSYTYMQINAAQVEHNLIESTIVDSDTKIPESHLRVLTNLQPDQQVNAYRRAEKTAPNGVITAKHLEATVHKMHYTEITVVQLSEPQTQAPVHVWVTPAPPPPEEPDEELEDQKRIYALIREGEELYAKWEHTQEPQGRHALREELMALMIRVEQEEHDHNLKYDLYE